MRANNWFLRPFIAAACLTTLAQAAASQDIIVDNSDPAAAALSGRWRTLIRGAVYRRPGESREQRAARYLATRIDRAEVGRTIALFQVGGPAWKTWNEQIHRRLLDRQRRDGHFCCFRGSWDADGAGGRVVATAFCTLVSEVFWRYDRVFGTR